MAHLDVLNAKGTVLDVALNLAAHQRLQAHRQQDAPPHEESITKFLKRIGGKEYYDFGGHLISRNGHLYDRNIESSRSTFSPMVFYLVIAVVGVTGGFFIRMLTAQIKP